MSLRPEDYEPIVLQSTRCNERGDGDVREAPYADGVVRYANGRTLDVRTCAYFRINDGRLICEMHEHLATGTLAQITPAESR